MWILLFLNAFYRLYWFILYFGRTSDSSLYWLSHLFLSNRISCEQLSAYFRHFNRCYLRSSSDYFHYKAPMGSNYLDDYSMLFLFHQSTFSLRPYLVFIFLFTRFGTLMISLGVTPVWLLVKMERKSCLPRMRCLYNFVIWFTSLIPLWFLYKNGLTTFLENQKPIQMSFQHTSLLL